MELSAEQRHRILRGCDGIVVTPDDDRPHVAILVLSGSSGRIDQGRAHLLAAHGALATSVRWFGGPGQPPGICEIPLETFTMIIDELVSHEVDHIAIIGISKGAEAALLAASIDPRIDTVVAISPSAVSWANIGPGFDGRTTPWRSSWLWQGNPVPFVPYDVSWQPKMAEPVAYRDLYEQSLETFPNEVSQATIRVEDTRAKLVLIAGGDDRLWPSVKFTEMLVARRRSVGLQVTTIIEESAGHRPWFPGELEPALSPTRLYGGVRAADRSLGEHKGGTPSVDTLGLRS